MEAKKYWVYILECENGALYTGYTTDLAKRFQSHLTGSGKCKYTHSFKAKCIAQSWQILGNKALAMKVERFLKNLSRPEKINYIQHADQLANHFPPHTISRYLIK